MAIDRQILLDNLNDARLRTLELVRGLDAEQLMGPKLPTVNPLLWEIGHLAWFHEHWILHRLDGRPPLLANADALYDSTHVAHDTRWSLALPTLDGTLAYMNAVHQSLIDRLDHEPSADEQYFYQLTAFHEDMHTEAFIYTRQALAYPAPSFAASHADVDAAGPLPGDVAIAGGELQLGADKAQEFVFDNEKWAHPITVAPFRMARAALTNAEYAAFVEAGGYRQQALWSSDGWAWREKAGLQCPVYWRSTADGWDVRYFDGWRTLAPHQPVIHVSWYEVDAYCRWAGRRLPTEEEWELAASTARCGHEFDANKRRYPWGNAPPTARHANLDGRQLGCVDVAACADGDSAYGCRQMLGNVWEWTASDFQAFPGFSPDPYREYSEPWFGSRKVLRGGAWATRSRMLWNTWRNFFPPDRNDIFAGFRTCALA